MIKSFIPNSIRGRIQLSVFLTLLFTFWILSWQTVEGIEEEFSTYHQERLMRKAKTVMAYVEMEIQMNENWRDQMVGIISRAEIINSLRLNYVDALGKEVFKTTSLFNMVSQDSISAINKQEKDFIIESLDFEGEPYLSAYFNIIHKGKYAGVVHIPYKLDENKLDEEIMSLLMRLIPIHIALFVIVALLASWFTARLTKSLSIVSRHFEDLKIGGRYERISWDRDDEIGGLLEAYNRMVDDLEESVNRLAKSEREGAWRNMAKQVAHEIKNPLTPMKLSIQHLKRVYADDQEKGEQMLHKVMSSLIEQIDHLSTIATEFSSFAQLPKFKMEVIPFKEFIEPLALLYRSDEVEVKLHLHDEAQVYADRMQLNRVYTNLFKNSIQAKRREENLVINITTDSYNGSFEVHFYDNGTGIPEELQDRIFQPNFSTKNSGMGIGLAMSKSIIEEMGGDIICTSGEHWTEFLITLPEAPNKEV